MVFLHLSDIHFLRSYPKADSGYNSIFNNMSNPIIQIQKCLEKVNINDLDFIIITGDLVETGNYEDYKVLKENLDELLNGVPYMITLGNHDNKKEFYKGWFNIDNRDESYNDTNEVNGLRIISFDNSEHGNNNGNISSKQCEWLRDELKKSPKQDTILLLHHHLLKEQFSTASVIVQKEFEDVVRNSNIVGVFCGHTHHPFVGTFADKPYFSAGSLSFVGYDEQDGLVRFEEAPSCNLCTYEDGKISVEVISVLEEHKSLGYVNFKN